MPTLAVDTCCFPSHRSAKVKCVICESVWWAVDECQNNKQESYCSLATHFPLQMLSPTKKKWRTTKLQNKHGNSLRNWHNELSWFRGAFPLMRQQMKSGESAVYGKNNHTLNAN